METLKQPNIKESELIEAVTVISHALEGASISHLVRVMAMKILIESAEKRLGYKVEMVARPDEPKPNSVN